MIRSSCPSFVAMCIALVTQWFSPAWAGTLSMKDHMALLSEPRRAEELTALPSIQIDSIQASVPVDDRMNADAAFNAPFTESLREGMVWYLTHRGVRVLTTGADLRCTGVIDSYEGWKGWGHWGADVHLRVKLFRGSQLVLSEDLRSFLKYSDDEDVEEEERPKYEAHNLRGRFGEILFTRVGIDLSEKFIALMREKGSAVSSPESGTTQADAVSRGKLSIESTVPNAEVFVDGKLVGTTPIAEIPLSATSHTIEIRKRGFAPWKREVAVIEGAVSRITAELETEKPE
jgi:hypothetical protein